MINITGKVNGQTLILRYAEIVSGTRDYLTGHFDFDSDWTPTHKWVHFAKGDVLYDIRLNESGDITRDKHLNLGPGVWQVYIHGTAESGMLIQSDNKPLIVTQGLPISGQPLPPIPPTAAEQIEQLAQDAKDIAQSVRDDADAGLFNGPEGPPGKDGNPGVWVGSGIPPKGTHVQVDPNGTSLDGKSRDAIFFGEGGELQSRHITPEDIGNAGLLVTNEASDAKKRFSSYSSGIIPSEGCNFPVYWTFGNSAENVEATIFNGTEASPTYKFRTALSKKSPQIPANTVTWCGISGDSIHLISYFPEPSYIETNINLCDLAAGNYKVNGEKLFLYYGVQGDSKNQLRLADKQIVIVGGSTFAEKSASRESFGKTAIVTPDISSAAYAKLGKPIQINAYYFWGASGFSANAYKGQTLNVQSDNVTPLDSYSASAMNDIVKKAIHTTLNVEIEDDGFGGYRADYNDNDINNHRNAGGVVQAKYYDAAKNQTYTYYYSTMEGDRKPTFIRTYIENSQTVQVLISIGNDKRVTVERRSGKSGAFIVTVTSADSATGTSSATASEIYTASQNQICLLRIVSDGEIFYLNPSEIYPNGAMFETIKCFPQSGSSSALLIQLRCVVNKDGTANIATNRYNIGAA